MQTRQEYVNRTFDIQTTMLFSLPPWNLHNFQRRRCFRAKIECNEGLVEYIKRIWTLMGPGLSAFLAFCARCALYGVNASQSPQNAFTFHSGLMFSMRSFRSCTVFDFPTYFFISIWTRTVFHARLAHSLSAGFCVYVWGMINDSK